MNFACKINWEFRQKISERNAIFPTTAKKKKKSYNYYSKKKKKIFHTDFCKNLKSNYD